MGTRYNKQLDPKDAVRIRQEYAAAGGRLIYKDLALKYGVSESTIARVVKGHTYMETLSKGEKRQEDLDRLKRTLLQTQHEVELHGEMQTIPEYMARVGMNPAKARAHWLLSRTWPEGYIPTAEDWEAVSFSRPESDSENQLGEVPPTV